MKDRLFAIVLACTLALFLTAGAGFSAEPAQNQVWRWGHHTSDLDTMDPAFAVPDMTYSAGNGVFNGLVRLRPGTLDFDNLEGDLAESWKISADGLVYTFNLRKGVQWHKGYGEFTSEDVKYTFERMKNPKLGTPYGAKFLIIKEIKVLDKYTVQIILNKPSPFFIMDHCLAYQAGMIVSKKQGEEKGLKNLGNDVIGTGPFMFEDYKAKEKITFVRNPHYFRGAPTLERLEMNFMPNVAARTMAFIKGDLDAIYGERDTYWVDDVKKTKTVIIDSVPLGSGGEIHFNMTRKPLDNLKVRQALALATDRNAFKEYFGVVWTEMTAPVPPSYYATLPKDKTPKDLIYNYDPAKAKKLLAEAGYPNGFKLMGYVTDKPYYQSIMEICQELWKPLGVDLEIRVVDHTTFHANIRKDMNDVIVYYAGRSPTADAWLTQFYYGRSCIGKPTQVTNFSHFGCVDADGDGQIDTVDPLIEAARSEINKEKQKQIFYDAQLQILKMAPSKSLHELTKVFARHDWFDPGVKIEGSMIFGYPLEKARILKH